MPRHAGTPAELFILPPPPAPPIAPIRAPPPSWDTREFSAASRELAGIDAARDGAVPPPSPLPAPLAGERADSSRGGRRCRAFSGVSAKRKIDE